MAERKGLDRVAEGLLDHVRNEMLSSATDWVVELMEGVQFRYTCPVCVKMPLKSCHVWRLSRKAGLGGSVQSG
eukprot:6799852-Lingulodinium_polyedra.AAC.1